MPEGTILCVMLVFVLSASTGVVVYCLRLARKYRRIETDMNCIYENTMHPVIEIIFSADDWFMRKVRLHTDAYPYVIEVLISEVKVASGSKQGG